MTKIKFYLTCIIHKISIYCE